MWLILVTSSLDNVLLGENWCWSPLGLKRVKNGRPNRRKYLRFHWRIQGRGPGDQPHPTPPLFLKPNLSQGLIDKPPSPLPLIWRSASAAGFQTKTDIRGRGLNEAHVTDLVFQQGVKGQSKSYQEQQKYQEKLRECIHYTGKHHNVYSKPGKLSYEQHQGHPGKENW